jgi:phage repressor protein C with HTH and peptisase S24 domain
MSSASDRLRALAELAGYDSLAEFARAAGIPDGTMRQHVARNSIPKDAAAAYLSKARKTGATLEWLIHGRGTAPNGVREEDRPQPERHNRRLDRDVVAVYQIDTGSMAGLGTNNEVEITQADAEAVYTFPSSGFREQYGATPEGVIIDEVRGDSQVPTLNPGQRIMINLRDRKPSPPGFFLVWDGLGMVLKRIELIPGSNPPTIRLLSDNPRYPSYERTLEEAQISGRVIGLWSRL